MHQKIYIGAHTSASGGVHFALLQGQEIGANTIQLFTSNQKQWKGKPIDEEEVKRFWQAKESTGIEKIMSHDSYLINLGSPDSDIIQKSNLAFEDEIKRCHQLDLDFLNFHPGAATTGSKEECLDQIIASLKHVEKLTSKGRTRLLLETTAGQGTSVGSLFQEIGYILHAVKKIIPIGVCIDTCHIFAAGYDIRDDKGWESTLNEFDKHVGLEHLYAMHVNDSMKPLGSKKDRHASLGEGEIGLQCFQFIMQDKRLKYLPKYLETPMTEKWKEEIQMLREFSHE
ncbi:MAG: deoxyribonuclease IV [Chlamydiales bacterium]|nr:deoxyribonuclease IV [Chlamydiales bacterium]